MAKSTSLLVVIVGAAAVAALTCASGVFSVEPDLAPEGPTGRAEEREAVDPPRLAGSTPGVAEPETTHEDGQTPKPAQPEAQSSPDLEILYQEYSPGKPEEWPVVRFAKTGVMQPLEWWQSVIGEMQVGPSMDVEPYRIEFVFGDSDRTWLERVRKALDADRERAQREHRDPVRRLQALEDVTQEYARLLAAVAARRVGDDSETSRLFTDTRMLGQLERGSPDAAWLSAMISAVEHSYFWAFPEIVTPNDRQLICAADLPVLKRISMSLNGLEYGVTPKQRSDPDFLERVKAELQALADLVSRRR